MSPAEKRSDHDKNADDGCTGLFDALQRLASAPPKELNAAILEFNKIAWPILKPTIVRELCRKKVGGPDGMVDEVEDIWNRLLLKLTRGGAAEKTTAIDDESAKAWLITVTKNLIEDQAKTPRRRFWLYVAKLRSEGYHHDSWD